MDGSWPLLGLAATAFLSATILPGSSEALLAALLLASPDRALGFFLAATLGNTAGAALNWWLGRYLNHYADRRWFPVSPARLARVSHWFTGYGAWLLLFSWVPIVGDPMTVAAGLFRMRFLPFIVLVGVGKAARYAGIIGMFAALEAWLES